MRFENYLRRHSGQTFNEATNRAKVTAKQQLFFQKFSAAKMQGGNEEFIRCKSVNRPPQLWPLRPAACSGNVRRSNKRR